MPTNATLLPELQLLAERGTKLIAGIDEVGRGALAGPVTVGVVALDLGAAGLAEVDRDTGIYPPLNGVRDSKLLSAVARKKWAPVIAAEAAAHQVEHSSPEYIDAEGITAALRSAGRQGLMQVEAVLGQEVEAIILDGGHDWLFGGADPRVVSFPKADTLSLSTAAASVLAKVQRDALMAELDATHPGYGWASNKGYGSAAHRQAITELGVSQQHRRSWNLTPATPQALPGL